MKYQHFVDWFESHTHVDDTYFSYPGNEDCIIGAIYKISYDSNRRPLSYGQTTYWAGDGCDIHNGIGYSTARELFEAPIYEGHSIKDRWNEITWYRINGWMSEEDFDRTFEDDQPTSG